MKITFHSTRAKNFLQIGNEFETFPLDKNPFTVIVGKNGSGKSTLLDIITYALYGKSYRPKVTLSQLINSVNKKQMLVEIAFTAGAHTYIIRRGEKPKVFEIYKDKKMIEADPSIGSMQTFLEEQILGQNYKTFCQINVIGKSTYKQFMTLTLPERRSVVEDILDSNIYSVMSSLAKEDYKNLNSDIKDQERDITISQNNINNAKSIIAKYQDDRGAEITQLKAKISVEKNQVDEIASEIKNLDSQIADYEERLEKTIPNKHRNQFQEQLQKLSSKKSILESDKNKCLSIISKIDSLVNCPHCMQIVDESHKEAIKKQNQDQIEQFNSELDSIKIKLEKFQEIRNNFEELKDNLTTITRNKNSYENKLESINKTIEMYSDRIDQLSQPLDTSNLPDIAALQDDLDELTKSRDSNVKAATTLKKAISYLGDDGIKAKLIGKYISVINKSVNDYLARMNMFVEFTLDSEFNETIKAINRESFTYHSFSEGQKMRIDLAILLTWRKIAQLRNSMTTNLFLLDEVADGSLDQEGMDEFLDILKEVADAQNTFLISHKDSTIDKFDNVIRAETVGNFSKYTHE